MQAVRLRTRPAPFNSTLEVNGTHTIVNEAPLHLNAKAFSTTADLPGLQVYQTAGLVSALVYTGDRFEISPTAVAINFRFSPALSDSTGRTGLLSGAYPNGTRAGASVVDRTQLCESWLMDAAAPRRRMRPQAVCGLDPKECCPEWLGEKQKACRCGR